MAKQNIISDFSALKRKITFSENKPVGKTTDKNESIPPAEKTVRVLKVGQNNLSGQIRQH